ncbi:hypothetical protein DTO006G1_698 [Penicillium roqueforti]|nr:uncharacterized protein LCP9604111_1178 [Penicillium roqueforti]KAF9253652.1 hypothetical protein LCP9604111_1178 [Penicillium roqueforti]KAI1839169.1 hypothetical protein CBS147337_894 [Penicillium roqueforti]KAI2686325.1 hypothetical protein CBS147355_1812 [Penicillium roqueforti]KAI2691628.1 hypothetical protein LCP963914a_1829 [Penicillium roqueforti]KAI2706338.1 hypothetical protein CBS147372_249 [Penicillium roqueforti]
MTTSLEYLVGLEGTEVTLNSSPQPLFHTGTWEIVEKLEENAEVEDERDVADGLGPSDVAGKFLCRPAGSDAQKIAFMRIYKQIPIAGTEFQKPTIRAAQAVESPDYIELIALKDLREQGCDAVPKLLGYHSGKKGFWSYPISKREEIRHKFCEAYKKLVKCGYRPLMSESSKIIYDWNNGEMHISGFSNAVRIDTSEEWIDRIRIWYSLVLKSKEMDQFFPVTATDVLFDKEGWRW